MSFMNGVFNLETQCIANHDDKLPKGEHAYIYRASGSSPRVERLRC